MSTDEKQRCRVIVRRHRLTVEFHHVDMMRVVHNAQYFKWFEKGRFAIVNEVYDGAPEVGERLLAPVVMNHCDYLAPARFGDELIVTTRHVLTASWTGRFSFTHSVSHQKTKVELVSGRSDITVVDADTFRIVRELPEAIWDSYQNLR